MKNLRKCLLIGLAVSGLTCITSCSDDDSGNAAEQGISHIKVRMTDAPGDFDAVFVEVIDVKVKNNNNAGEEGWASIGNITPGIYNLLDLTGGVTVMLADNEIPSGYIGQIRLILGTHNTVVKDGVTSPLNTPSAQQSGLKLQINQTLEPGITYDFLIDFDVAQSVVVAGNSGNINLHPVLRVTTNAVNGAIKGTVLNTNFQTMVSVMVGTETISAYTNAEGVFVLHGLPEGVYDVTVTPDVLSGISVSTVENVAVTNGQITDIGILAL